MDRRDFFGIIAAPLLRNLVPPTPMAHRGWPTGGYVDPSALAILHPHENIISNQAYEILRDMPARLGRAARMKEEITRAALLQDGGAK